MNWSCRVLLPLCFSVHVFNRCCSGRTYLKWPLTWPRATTWTAMVCQRFSGSMAIICITRGTTMGPSSSISGKRGPAELWWCRVGRSCRGLDFCFSPGIETNPNNKSRTLSENSTSGENHVSEIKSLRKSWLKIALYTLG